MLVYPTPNNDSKSEMRLLLTVDLSKTVGVNEIVQWGKDTSYISLMARVQSLEPLVEGELSSDISCHSYAFIAYIHVNNHFLKMLDISDPQVPYHKMKHTVPHRAIKTIK